MSQETLTPEQIKEERESLERVVDEAVKRVEYLQKICTHTNAEKMKNVLLIKCEYRCPDCGKLF